MQEKTNINFKEFKEKMIKCLALQEQLNTKINPNWKEERTEKDFYRAIWLEAAELMEELPWKWWKKTETDFENLQIEIVDIFHFILSLILLKDHEWKKQNSTINYIEFSIPFLYRALEENDKKLNTEELITEVENLVRYAITERDTLTYLTFANIIKNTFESFDKLYLLYISKNILNHIRQEYGYNTGTYKKTINGLEDNKYLTKIVNQVNNEEELEKEIRKAFEELHNK
ncbi:MAG: dUTP diphosphatase [Sulfurihydrogenibium sp.]|nr:dUTP diphosphatase [Sulfurihydrogenibium sp.]